MPYKNKGNFHKPNVYRESSNFDTQTMGETVRGTLPTAGGYFDTRTGLFEKQVAPTANLDSDTTWYLNYLNYNAILAYLNPSAYASYLVRAGFVPVAMFPSYIVGVTYQDIINKIEQHTNGKLSYTQTRPLSFIESFITMQGYDIWVSKIDFAELYGVEPLTVTSKLVLEEILK